MSRHYPGAPPDLGPGYGNPDYTQPYNGAAQPHLPSTVDPDLGWYMDPPSLPNPNYAANSQNHGATGSQALPGLSGEKRRNKLGYHRTSVACSYCRRRKIRCIPLPSDIYGRCANCIRLRKECSFFAVEQQAGDPHSASFTQNSDGGVASNTPSPGPPLTERHPAYTSHVQPTFNPGQAPSSWPHSTVTPADELCSSTGREAPHNTSPFDYRDQTGRGSTPANHDGQMHLGMPDPNEHWKRPHSRSAAPDTTSESLFASEPGPRQDVGWRAPIRSTPTAFGSGGGKPGEGSRKASNAEVVIPSMTTSSPGFSDAGHPSRGAPIYGAPISYASMPVGQAPSRPPDDWHRRGPVTEIQAGFGPWAYPQGSPRGHRMPGDGS